MNLTTAPTVIAASTGVYLTVVDDNSNVFTTVHTDQASAERTLHTHVADNWEFHAEDFNLGAMPADNAKAVATFFDLTLNEYTSGAFKVR